MRTLSTHVLSEQDSLLEIRVKDERGHGNANHVYEFYAEPNDGNERGYTSTIHFQNGPIFENGVNGITNESLLAVVIDRLEGFQSGPYACQENQEALEAVRTAVAALKSRTLKRRERGVEGTSQV